MVPDEIKIRLRGGIELHHSRKQAREGLLVCICETMGIVRRRRL